MTETTTNAKQMSLMLNGVEKGDDMSVYIGEAEGHYRGEVIAIDDGENEAEVYDIKVTIDDGELTHEVCSRYTGDGGGEHALSDASDFDTFAIAGREYEVSALATWGESDVPNDTLSDFEDEEQEEIAERMGEELEDLSRALTELQAMRKSCRRFLDGDITLAEMEEEMRMVEMDSGGRLVLDRR